MVCALSVCVAYKAFEITEASDTLGASDVFRCFRSI